MEEKFFKSELEKDIFISAYTFYSEDGYNTQQRLERAARIVLDLRGELDKLLAIGAWAEAAAQASGIAGPPGASVFRNEIERKIWISAYTRGIPKSTERTARDRAKRAWELVLEFRQPSESPKDGWARAARELAGG